MTDRYSRTVLIDVLVHHWPTRTNGCECGWSVLGRSYPEHVANVFEASMSLAEAEFGKAMDDLMGALVDAGFDNVSTSATLVEQYGELSFYGDEAARLLKLVRLGLDAEKFEMEMDEE